MSVILFHAGLSLFSGGYIGVDVFFVISGYLITSIILIEKKSKTFSIIAFYERRARRILPALFLVLLITLPFAWLWMMPKQMVDFAGSLRSVVTMSSNIYFYTTSNYFDTAAEEKPLLHTWSLGLEEQFYLIFPLLIFLIWRFGIRPLRMTLTVLTIASFYTCLWHFDSGDSSENFYFLQTRAWELLVGSLTAFAFEQENFSNRVSPLVKNFLSAFGFILILYSIFAYSDMTPFPSFYAFAPVGGAALIILFADSRTWVGKFLSIKVFVSIGLFSYSLYLWHQPVFAFARIYSPLAPTQFVFIILALFCMGLAYLTWRFIEQPFRNRQIFNRTKIFSMAIIGTILFSAFGHFGVKTDGFHDYFEARLDANRLKMLKKIELATSSSGMNGMYENNDCKFWSTELTKIFKDRFKSCETKYQKAIFVLGDSHAMDLYNVIATNSNHPFVAGLVKPGCRPADYLPECNIEENSAFISEKRNSISTAFYTQSGLHMLTAGRYERSKCSVRVIIYLTVKKCSC